MIFSFWLVHKETTPNTHCAKNVEKLTSTA